MDNPFDWGPEMSDQAQDEFARILGGETLPANLAGFTTAPGSVGSEINPIDLDDDAAILANQPAFPGRPFKLSEYEKIAEDRKLARTQDGGNDTTPEKTSNAKGKKASKTTGGPRKTKAAKSKGKAPAKPETIADQYPSLAGFDIPPGDIPILQTTYSPEGVTIARFPISKKGVHSRTPSKDTITLSAKKPPGRSASSSQLSSLENSPCGQASIRRGQSGSRVTHSELTADEIALLDNTPGGSLNEKLLHVARSSPLITAGAGPSGTQSAGNPTSFGSTRQATTGPNNNSTVMKNLFPGHAQQVNAPTDHLAYQDHLNSAVGADRFQSTPHNSSPGNGNEANDIASVHRPASMNANGPTQNEQAIADAVNATINRHANHEDAEKQLILRIYKNAVKEARETALNDATAGMPVPAAVRWEAGTRGQQITRIQELNPNMAFQKGLVHLLICGHIVQTCEMEECGTNCGHVQQRTLFLQPVGNTRLICQMCDVKVLCDRYARPMLHFRDLAYAACRDDPDRLPLPVTHNVLALYMNNAAQTMRREMILCARTMASNGRWTEPSVYDRSADRVQALAHLGLQPTMNFPPVAAQASDSPAEQPDQASPRGSEATNAGAATNAGNTTSNNTPIESIENPEIGAATTPGGIEATNADAATNVDVATDADAATNAVIDTSNSSPIESIENPEVGAAATSGSSMRVKRKRESSASNGQAPNVDDNADESGDPKRMKNKASTDEEYKAGAIEAAEASESVISDTTSGFQSPQTPRSPWYPRAGRSTPPPSPGEGNPPFDDPMKHLGLYIDEDGNYQELTERIYEWTPEPSRPHPTDGPQSSPASEPTVPVPGLLDDTDEEAWWNEFMQDPLEGF